MRVLVLHCACGSWVSNWCWSRSRGHTCQASACVGGMCWSAEVSAAFAVYDFACVAWLARRAFDRKQRGAQRARDMWYAAFMAIIAVQEGLQMVLWFDDISSARSNDCTSTNRALSTTAVRLVWLIPLLNVTFFTLTHAGHSPTSWIKHALMVACGVCVLCVWASVSGCTTVGARGHQVWPTPAALRDVYGLPMEAVAYFVPNVAVGVLSMYPRRGRYCPALPVVATATIGGVLAGPLYVLLHPTDEFQSVWCWSAAAYGAYFVAEPRLLRLVGGGWLVDVA